VLFRSLDVARLEEGESMLLRLTPVEVPQLVRRLVEEIQQAHRAYHFHIEQQAAALTIEGDGNQLERVLGNMLSNAVKYSPAESTITVTLAAGECNDTPGVLISVRDEGVGIPSEDLPYVFEPFRRGSNVQTRTSGTGLGLASTRYVVEQHGGRVWVASDEGCGSTFTVWLPHCEGG
jgi:signal transduction histidine kinase